MHGSLLMTNGGSLGLSLLLAVLAVIGIGVAVAWASRNCETNAQVARRVRAGQLSRARVPRARVVRHPR